MDTSAPALRTLAHTLAQTAKCAFTLDLFATQGNALTPRFYSQWPEITAEAVDALAQPDWGKSYCTRCQCFRPEFVFLYPPYGLVKAAIRKARTDRARGVLVVPHAPSAHWWPAILPAPALGNPARCQPPRLPCSKVHVLNQSNPAGHYITILHFDFWQDTTPRPHACTHTPDYRGPHPGSSPQDMADKAAVFALLHTASPP